MPSGIDEIYAATIKRIEEQPKPKADLAKHILLWIRYASTLPTMEQLRHRLAVDPSTHRFDPDLLLPEATLISMCFGLIKDDKKLDAIFLIRAYFRPYNKHYLISHCQIIQHGMPSLPT
ncbi:hypothetical protein BKA70DRAFT_291795 [Coprinopsis sp. MPI-PUGE-AT-0042]|nr:hypothetical protein BKA70DRAFT_291795 [Coprinopsis sp. MPI-PUGE-AT-0042]